MQKYRLTNDTWLCYSVGKGSEVGGLSSKIITHENMPSKRTSGLTYDLNDIAKFYNYTGYSQISRTGFVFR